ncbi:MAG: hypothetical protein HFE84_01085 [Lachnospiraceae bacterium]|nr:hypothetical protein [Lachnospiraceae bacterium]
MKLTDLQVIKLMLPSDEWLLVKLVTDEGLCGWGEVTGSCDDNGLAAILTDAADRLRGKDPLQIQTCMKVLTGWRYPTLSAIRTYATAASGLNQALWDVSARHYGIPLYKLYGGDGAAKIPLYANLNKALWKKRSPEILRERGRLAAEAGFSLVKCTPFDEINPQNADNDLGPAFERMEALFEAVPIGHTAIDCHQRFTGYTLGRMVERLLSQFGLPYWIEDPVDVREYALMERMCARYPSIRWAAGEDALSIRQIMETVKSGCYEVIMPDIKYIGGPDAVRALIPVVEGCGCKVTLHNPNGLIATAHSAHASSLCQNALPMEFPFAAVEHRELLCEPNELVENGFYHFTDRPGIGIELSEQALKDYALRFVGGRWEKWDGK